jgi:hypothetical protein
MDDMQIYNRALSAAEITLDDDMRYLTAIFSIALALIFFALPFTASASTILKPVNNLGLIGYWPMNEGVGTSAGDASGFGNTGTFGNAAGTNPVWTTGKFGTGVQFNGANNFIK